MRPALWQAPDDDCMALHDIARMMTRAVQCRTRSKNRLHALGARAGTADALLKLEEVYMEYYSRKAEKLRALALKIIAKSTGLKVAFMHLCSVRGIGETTAITVLGV